MRSWNPEGRDGGLFQSDDSKHEEGWAGESVNPDHWVDAGKRTQGLGASAEGEAFLPALRAFKVRQKAQD